MTYDVRAASFRMEGTPVHRVLQSFPIAGFTCALLTDILYWLSADMIWADFSAWLLAVGFGGGVMAAIAWVINLIRHRPGHSGRATAIHLVGSLVVMILAGVNNLVHSRDAWTSVVPTGLILSSATVVVMLLTFWLGSRQMYRDRIVVNQIGAAI